MATDFNKFDNCWLAVQVRHGWETRSAGVLTDNGHESFVPLYQRRRRWADRTKVTLVPLFPGYVFLRFHAGNRHPVIHAAGVIRFVGMGNSPVPIDNSEIEALLLATRSKVACGPCPFLEVGREIQVKSGPLAGIRGTIARFKNKDRLIISVTQLRRSMFVELDGFEVA
jgi:transcription antitermination factor NusG